MAVCVLTLRAWLRKIVPELTRNSYKGQSGKLGVLGGCALYTGAPYYAGMATLRLGADLATVFCTADAAVPIKAYSPELMVHGVLPSQPTGDAGPDEAVAHVGDWAKRLHVLVVGPGLGRDDQTLACTAKIISACREKGLPLVLDADALWLVAQQPSLILGYRSVVLTPNAMEFKRLWDGVFGPGNTELSAPPMDLLLDPHLAANIWPPPTQAGQASRGSSGCLPNDSELAKHTAALAERLGGVTILRKGAVDVLSDGKVSLFCSEGGSPRRCGGQGDVLAGAVGWLLHCATQHWQQPRPDRPPLASEPAAKKRKLGPPSSSPSSGTAFSSLPADCTLLSQDSLSPTLLAALAGSLLTRHGQARAFAAQGRAMGPTHVLEAVPTALEQLLQEGAPQLQGRDQTGPQPAGAKL